MLKHLQALIITGVLSLFCISQAIASDTLVVYFSRSGNQFNGNITEGNTAIVAKIIAKELNADTFEIKPKKNNYNLPYRELTELARDEKEKGLRPEYIGEIENLSSYSTVYIGSPVWWGDYPMIMYTFFEKNDLNGKTVIPFATHEGSGLSSFDLILKDKFKTAKVLPGLALKGSQVQNDRSFAETEVKKFMSSLEK
ncbi:flavodoxin [Succinivibrio dextrinosolvens]|uniref:flavodoxin n=1 Tax=Succinivibrio dextrinosolvens TaxID=83771 RepID=UPI00241F1301|nr:flavodoxin [Succinivibrio dextrinosolvens]MBE6421921.1 flavodoxin [Succinivibrio dextrinosolvens]